MTRGQFTTTETPGVTSSKGHAIKYAGQKWGGVPTSAFGVPVSPGAKAVFAYLWTWVGAHEEYHAWPGQRRMRRELGMPDTSLRRYLTELREAGCIVRWKRAEIDPNWRGNLNANLYELRLPDPVPEPDRVSTGERTDRVSTDGRSDRPRADDPCVHGRTDIEQTIEQTITTLASDKTARVGGEETENQEPRPKPSRNGKSHDPERKALEEQFVLVTGIRPPGAKTKKQHAAAGELWWSPLREIGVACEWDVARGKKLITDAVQKLRQNNCTVCTPKSIVKMCIGLRGEQVGGRSSAQQFLDSLEGSPT